MVTTDNIATIVISSFVVVVFVALPRASLYLIEPYAKALFDGVRWGALGSCEVQAWGLGCRV